MVNIISQIRKYHSLRSMVNRSPYINVLSGCKRSTVSHNVKHSVRAVRAAHSVYFVAIVSLILFYSEFLFLDKLWPDFTEENTALRDAVYKAREAAVDAGALMLFPEEFLAMDAFAASIDATFEQEKSSADFTAKAQNLLDMYISLFLYCFQEFQQHFRCFQVL